MMDLPMDTLKDMDIILDAFSRIAKMVDTLRRCGTEIETTLGIVAKSLSKLLSDGDNSEYFRGSFILIKAWVKVLTKNNSAFFNTYYVCVTMFCFLNYRLYTKILGIIRWMVLHFSIPLF